jgi:hypothetical protein
MAAQVVIGRNLVTRWHECWVQPGLAIIERHLPRGAPLLKVNVSRLVELTIEITTDAQRD